MPKVTISTANGIVQEAGSGLVVKNTADFQQDVQFNGNQVHGHKKHVSLIGSSKYGAGGRYELSGSDSGRTFIIGDKTGVGTIQIPNASAGWNARFVLTGAIGAAITLSASISSTVDPWTGAVLAENDGGESGDMPITAGTGVVIGTGVEAGDSVTVEIVGAGTANYFVSGRAAQ